MALKDTWIDKVDEVDDILAEDINDIAHTAIESEKNRLDKVTTKGSLRAYGVDETGNQTIFPVTKENDANSLAMTDDYGNLKSSIPREDYDVVNKIYADNTFANGLRGKKSGTMVSMDDVSPLEHKIPVRLESENLLPYPYTLAFGRVTTVTESGVTFTDNGDGGILINGTPEAQIGLDLSSLDLPFDLPVAATSNGYTTNSIDGHESGIAYSKIAKRVFLRIWESEGAFDNVLYYPKLQKGTVATPYTPYVADDTAVTVKSCGKNLIAPNDLYYAGRSVTRAGVTFTVNDDLSIHIKGSSTSGGDSWFSFTNFDIRAIDCSTGTYTVSQKIDGIVTNTDGRLVVEGKFINSDKTEINNCDIHYFAIGSQNKVVTIDQPLRFQGAIYVAPGIEVDCTVYLQLEKGTVATPWEPYIEGETIEVTIGSDNINVLSPIAPNMTITTDNSGVILDVEYKRDTNIAFEKLEKRLLSLETAIATT